MRRFVLVGLMVLQDTMMQLLIGTFLATLFLLLQVQASPYRAMADDLLASSMSFALVVLFLCATAFKYTQLTGLDDLVPILSREQRQLYVLNNASLTFIMLGSVIGGLFVFALLFAVQVGVERARLRREAISSKARRLRRKADGKEVAISPAPDGSFHLFLSHVWGTGQDQMRVVKQRLLEMLPDARIFLDVDDLQEGRGAEYVDCSETILIFVSDGYFNSPNCMRELLRALFDQKPLLTLAESEKSKGALTLEQVLAQLKAADGNYGKWGLEQEMVEWGMRQPTAQQLHGALFAECEPIEWNRIGFFQDVTLRLIAEQLLPEGYGKTYVQGEIVSRNLPALRVPSNKFHIFRSEHNPGAEEFVTELMEKRGLSTLCVSSTLDELAECDHMLVYLNGLTWTSGMQSAAFAAHVTRAMDEAVHLMLVHEMPGPGGQDVRHGCEFGSFFACDDGATPTALLKRGIYQQIALALKGGMWREASLALGHATLVSTGNELTEVVARASDLRHNSFAWLKHGVTNARQHSRAALLRAHSRSFAQSPDTHPRSVTAAQVEISSIEAMPSTCSGSDGALSHSTVDVNLVTSKASSKDFRACVVCWRKTRLRVDWYHIYRM